MFRDKIFSLTFELTYSCNFRCVHCFQRDEDKCLMYSNECINKSIQIAQELDVQRFSLFGGEPLLHPNFINIYNKIYDYGFQISIITNGSLITSEIACLFKRKPPCILWVSLYGINETDYKLMTGKASNFNSTFKGLGYLKENEVCFRVKGIATNINNQLSNFEEFIRPFTTEYKIFRNIFPTRSRKNDNLSYNVLYNKINSNFPHSDINISERKKNDGYLNCGCYFLDIVISPDGFTRPCVLFPRNEITNILSSEITAILDNNRKQYLEEYIFPDKCKKCDYILKCGCPIILKYYGDKISEKCQITYNKFSRK